MFQVLCVLTRPRDPFAAYGSERAPAVQDLVAKYDQPATTPAVEDKPVVMESDPEVHGAPSMYSSTCSPRSRLIWLHMF